MIADYTDNANLFEKCITLIGSIFPGCKEFALKGINYGASWKDGSTPFIIEDKSEIIAHAGVWPITAMLNGEVHQTASIHGVCVSPLHRGKGYFKQLMQEAIDYCEKNFQSSLFFTTKPYLYKSYPYKIMLPEYDFVLNENIRFASHNSDLRILNLDNPEDLFLLHQLLANRSPLSSQLGFYGKNANTLFILNTLHSKLYYSEKLNTIIVYQISDDTLYIKEIVTQKQLTLQEVIGLIAESFNKVVLQFCPDMFLAENEYSAILARPEQCVMTSQQFIFNGKNFRYPELYWC